MLSLAETPLTVWLLALNVLVSTYVLFIQPEAMQRLSLHPDRVLRKGEWYRLLTSGFVHVGLAHLAFNMVTLYFFGPVMERLLGSLRFGLLYLGSGLLAHAYSLWRHRRESSYSAVGASGAISGIVFSFILFFPFEKLYIFFIPVGIPAIAFAFLYMAISIYGIRQESTSGGGIAHDAHLAGALGGWLLTFLLEPRTLHILLSHFR